MSEFSPRQVPVTRERVVSSVLWVTVTQYSGQIVSWAITLYVIRLLTPDDYGLMAKASVVISILLMLSEMGFGAALIQRSDLGDGEIASAFGCILGANGLLFLLINFISPALAVFFADERLVPLYRILSLQFILASCIVIPQSILMREMRFRAKSQVDLIAALAASLSILVLALLEYGVFALAGGLLVSQTILLVGYNLKMKRLIIPKMEFRKIKELLCFGSCISGSRILWYTYSNADQLIGGKYLKSREMGLYSIALNLVSIPLDKFMPILNQVFLSSYASVQNDPGLIRRYYLKSVRIVSLCLFPVCWGLIGVVPELISILGDQWRDIVLPMQILCLIIPFRAISTLMAPVLQGSGKPGLELSNIAILNVIIIPSFLLGVHWGASGLCLAWVAGYLAAFVIISARSLKSLGIPVADLFAAARAPMAAATLMLGIIYSVKMNLSGISTLVACPVLIGLGALTYASLMRIFNRESLTEILFLLKSVRARRSLSNQEQ